MNAWSLKDIFANLNEDVCQRLGLVRNSFAQSVTKGDASENVWLDLLKIYLPKRYAVTRAHVVDSKGKFSEQIDVVVYDAQYSPLIFLYEEQTIIPAESVYAVFEVKQTLNAKNVEYACKKVTSVRRLYRTTMPIPHAGGTYPKKPLIPIYGGLLTLDSDWKPVLGKPLLAKLDKQEDCDRLNLGCVAAHGYFKFNETSKEYETYKGGNPATAFLLTLISQLQSSGTVPMIDIQAYARWLE